MNFILEFRSFYKVGDIVLIQYWYNKMVTPVKILEKKGKTFTVSHNIPDSKIQNAPNDRVKSSDIISIHRIK